MQNELLLFFSFAVLTVISGILQRAGLGELWGVGINLVLASVVASALLLRSFWKYLFIDGFGVLILKFYPGWDKESLVLIAVFTAIFIINKFLPWRSFINMFFLVFFGVLAIYALIDFDYLAVNYYFVGIEIIYDVLFAWIFYSGLSKLFY